jgi:hypothetical protein
MCNKSNYHIKPILTYFEIGEAMKLIKYVIYITSFLLCLFGIVSNILVVVTISDKDNIAEFKGINQYSYMRINSICSCLLLSIHFLSWISDCVYPYSVFCSQIRKTLFVQYIKIVVIEVLATCLRFMINFLNIAFSFSRIALIGMDHNKLVKFMSEIGIKKYVAISLLFSSILSVIKYFSYKINYGLVNITYPIHYDYESVLVNVSSRAYFVINFVSDLFNYIVFLLIHLSIDIGMVLKLRQTLNEKLEKSKEYNTAEQQEKKQGENDAVLNNVIFMVILNTVVGFVLKLPTCIYSLIFMYFNFYSANQSNLLNHPAYGVFFKSVCLDSYFCDMLLTLDDFLYFCFISLQFFFYKRFDKKFKTAYERAFASKKNIEKSTTIEILQNV